jgi:O-antigen ligase/tetratricopeptide (TPR) repeat protein
MIDKIIKYSLPVTLLVLVVQTFSGGASLQFLNPYGMLILGLAVYSIGWWVADYLYSENIVAEKDYSFSRKVALAAIFATPIVAIVFTPSYLYPYIVGKGFIFRMLSIVAVLGAVYTMFTHADFKPRLTPFMLGSFVFTLAMGIATLFSMDPGRSFWSNFERMEGYINVLFLFFLVFSIVTMRVKELEWEKVFKVHLWVSGIISSVAVLQYFIGQLGLKGLANFPILNLCLNNTAGCRVDATLGNSIYLGLYAALSFWLVIYVIFAKRVNSTLLNILAGVHLLAVYFSGTRGVWVGMLAGLAVLFVSKYYFDGNKKAVVTTILSGLLFVVVFAGFVTYANKNGIAQDVAIVKRFSSVNTLFSRFTIWEMAGVSWLQKPLFGWGQENFIHAFNLNYDPRMYGQETYFDHPHNTYLGWLVTGGILGFLAFLFMMYMAVLGAIRTHVLDEKKNDLVLPIIFAFFVTYLVHIFFVFDNLTSSLLLVFAATYFGSGVSYGLININTLSKTAINFLKIGIVAVFAICIYGVIYKPAYANSMVIEAMTYANRVAGNPDQVIAGTQKKYEDAIAMNTLGNYEIREFYLQKSLEYAGRLGEVQDEKVKNSIVNLATSALNQFQIQITENPFDHRAHFMLGLYYLNLRSYDTAIEVLKKALDLAPNKQIALIYLAKAYLLKGDIQNASIYYEKAISVTPKTLAGKAFAGYNQIRIEYIQVLMLANQDEKAVKIIQDLIPSANREEFNNLVTGMMQVYQTRKDLKGIVQLLSDANQLDPTNQNFILWLAQAYVAGGDANAAMFTINKLDAVNPEVVAQFTAELQKLVEQQNAQKAQAEAEKASPKK